MNSYLNNGPGSKRYEDGPSNIVIQLDVTDPLLRNPRIFIGCWIIWSDGITEGDEGGGKYTHMYETLQRSWGVLRCAARRGVLLMVNHTARQSRGSHTLTFSSSNE